jgi:hypothetical protein
MAAPTVTANSDTQQVMEGLTQTIFPVEAGVKGYRFANSTSDRQFTVVLELQEPQGVKLLNSERAKEDNPTTFSLNLYPGETIDFLQGKWKAMRRKVQQKVPDQGWQQAQTKKVNAAVTAELARMDALGKRYKISSSDSEGLSKVCVKESVSFVDLAFPPLQASISRPTMNIDAQLTPYPWNRPASYCKGKEPCLYVNTIEPEDIDQGLLGDCYFLCALACVSEFPDLVKDVFWGPQTSELGIYRVRLCKDGLWQSLTLDDFVPVNPTTGAPVFAKNREEPEELWVSLLEKAYAKLHGSYAAIRSGDPAQAVSDITGGPYEKLTARPEWDDKAKLFDFCLKCDQADHIMSLATPGTDPTTMGSITTAAGLSQQQRTTEEALAEKYAAVGLTTGHAFSLIRVKQTTQGHKLCMIRNPWGNEKEWNGDWSDSSPLWTDDIKIQVGFYKADDGTFWMSWDDVWKWFTAGSVTYNLPIKAGWTQLRVKGQLQKGVPTVLLEVTALADTKTWFGAHQKDPRGLPATDPDSKLMGLLSVLMVKAEDGSNKTTRAGGPVKDAFTSNRDVYFEANLTKGKTYVLLTQGFQDSDKSVLNQSIWVLDDSTVSVKLLRFREGEAKKFNPVSKFTTEGLEPVPSNSASYQIFSKRYPVPVNVGVGGPEVKWDSTPSQDQMQDIKAMAAGNEVKTGESATVKSPATAPADALPKKAQAPGPSNASKQAAPAPKTQPVQEKPPTPPTAPPEDDDVAVPMNTQSSSSFDSLPPRLRTNSNNANQIKRQGWMEKYSTGRRTKGVKAVFGLNWKRRYFKLYGDGRLAYFETITSPEPKDTMLLRSSTVSLYKNPLCSMHPQIEPKGHYLLLRFQERDEDFFLLLKPDNAEEHASWGSSLAEYTTSKRA